MCLVLRGEVGLVSCFVVEGGKADVYNNWGGNMNFLLNKV